MANLQRISKFVLRNLNHLRQKPLAANIEVTYRCNLRCRMCGVWERGLKKHDPPELSWAEYSGLFADLRKSGVSLVTLTGGEPLIRDDIGKIMQSLRQENIRCNIFTNGTLLDREKASLILRNKVNKVIFSIDGTNSLHDRVRGIPGCFPKAVGGIKTLIRAKHEQGSFLPEIDIHMTISSLNVAGISELAKVAGDLGIAFSFQPFSESSAEVIDASAMKGHSIASPRYLPHNESLYLKDSDLRILREEIKKLNPNFYTKMVNSLEEKTLAGGRFPIKHCYITRDCIFVDPYGNVFPCTNLDTYIMGNVRKESIRTIWNSQKRRELREVLKKKPLPICRHCCHLSYNLTTEQIVKILLGRKL